jgi:hypothetical protein
MYACHFVSYINMYFVKLSLEWPLWQWVLSKPMSFVFLIPWWLFCLSLCLKLRVLESVRYPTLTKKVVSLLEWWGSDLHEESHWWGKSFHCWSREGLIDMKNLIYGGNRFIVGVVRVWSTRRSHLWGKSFHCWSGEGLT